MFLTYFKLDRLCYTFKTGKGDFYHENIKYVINENKAPLKEMRSITLNQKG